MKTIAISHTWPDIRNAEYEVLQRLISAAELISVGVIVIDRSGTILWHSQNVAVTIGGILQRDQADLQISLHFESPKVIDIYSYYALWQPLEFYSIFGYEKTTRSMLSHDDFLSCDSEMADAHGLNLLEATKRSVPEPLTRLFHTLPQPFLEPKIDESACVFYVGVNWERLGKPKGRFHDALIILANKGLVEIYGPELLLGVAPWQGFDAYQGELPFDGESIKFALNRAGICLALSSNAHVESGIMSNRLFEGFAGGAAVICNNNPFIAKHFGDTVYIVDSERGEEALAMQIIQVVRKIRANPLAAKEKVIRAQQIMRERFALEANLKTLVETHEKRRTQSENKLLLKTSVTLIIDIRGQDLSALEPCARSLRVQKQAIVSLYVICDANVARRAREEIKSGDSIQEVHILPIEPAKRTIRLDDIPVLKVFRGPIVADILAKIDTAYFGFANVSQTFFENHFSLLASAIERTHGAQFGCSDFVRTTNKLSQIVKEIECTDYSESALLNAETRINDVGCFLFAAPLAGSIPKNLFTMLDSGEHLFFQIIAIMAGPLASTFQPTVDKDFNTESLLPVPDDRERQYVRDHFRFDFAWRRAVKQSGASMPLPTAEAADSSSHAEFPLIQPNRRYSTSLEGDGLLFLTAGFSKPETKFIWCLKRGIIDFSLPDVRRLESVSTIFRLSIAGRDSYHTGKKQFITYAVNGSVVGYFPVDESEHEVSIHVPLSKLPAGNRFRLELIADHAEPSYSATGEILDPRLMSFYIASFVLEQVSFLDAPEISVGERIEFSKTGIGRKIAVQGFHDAEDDLIWIAGVSGRLQFRISKSIPAGVITMLALGRTSLETGEDQTVTISVNGLKNDAPQRLSGLMEIRFELDKPIRGGDIVDVRIDLNHAEAVFDQAHAVVDPRLLGLAIKSIVIDMTPADLLSCNGNRGEQV